MIRAMRKRIKDVIAFAILGVVGLAVAYHILQNQRLRIPVLEDAPFQLKAEFTTGQAITPGQGQTVRVSGRAGRRHLQGRAPRRPRDRHAGLRQQVVQAGPHRRHGPAAAQDRAEGHVHRARPGDAFGAGGARGLDAADPLDAARRQPGRDPRRAGPRHARLPQAAGQRRRARADRPRHGPARRAQALRADLPRPRAASSARSPSGRPSCGGSSRRWPSSTRSSPARTRRSASWSSPPRRPSAPWRPSGRTSAGPFASFRRR